MAKTGRNDPCPCGSGKKYKRCCSQLHEAAVHERKHLLDEPIPIELLHAEVDELCALSNRLNGLIRAGALDDAEQLGHELLRRYPDQMDGLDGLARVYDARGESAKAAEYYRKAALFADRGEGYDPELIADLRRRAEELDATPSGGDSAPAAEGN